MRGKVTAKNSAVLSTRTGASVSRAKRARRPARPLFSPAAGAGRGWRALCSTNAVGVLVSCTRRGRVIHILPTSTGATGNTPEGKWKIRWKAPSTRTWLGSAILFRTMTFKGNEFAIHGFAPVPSFPASHGCARIPLWAADWLYRQSPVGEAVYVYR